MSTPHHTLLRSLMDTILLVIHSPSIGGGLVGRLSHEGLFKVLVKILQDWKPYGSAAYCLALSLFGEIIQAEPSSYGVINDTGLPGIVIDAIRRMDSPTSEVLCSLCNALSAICLNREGINKILEGKLLHTMLSVFTTEQFVEQLAGDTSGMLGSAFSELLRHHPQMKPGGLDACYSLIQKVIELGNEIASPEVWALLTRIDNYINITNNSKLLLLQ